MSLPGRRQRSIPFARFALEARDRDAPRRVADESAPRKDQRQIVGATARKPHPGFQELRKLRPALELIAIEGASHGGALGAMRRPEFICRRARITLCESVHHLAVKEERQRRRSSAERAVQWGDLRDLAAVDATVTPPVTRGPPGARPYCTSCDSGDMSTRPPSRLRRFGEPRRSKHDDGTLAKAGGMAEWSMAVVLKTTEPGRVPGVRIPLPPPNL
jgi:hypothetical protein